MEKNGSWRVNGGDYKFHLALAVREPDELNLFMGNTLSPELMELYTGRSRKESRFRDTLLSFLVEHSGGRVR